MNNQSRFGNLILGMMLLAPISAQADFKMISAFPTGAVYQIAEGAHPSDQVAKVSKVMDQEGFATLEESGTTSSLVEWTDAYFVGGDLNEYGYIKFNIALSKNTANGKIIKLHKGYIFHGATGTGTPYAFYINVCSPKDAQDIVTHVAGVLSGQISPDRVISSVDSREHTSCTVKTPVLDPANELTADQFLNMDSKTLAQKFLSDPKGQCEAEALTAACKQTVCPVADFYNYLTTHSSSDDTKFIKDHAAWILTTGALVAAMTPAGGKVVGAVAQKVGSVISNALVQGKQVISWLMKNPARATATISAAVGTTTFGLAELVKVAQAKISDFSKLSGEDKAKTICGDGGALAGFGAWFLVGGVVAKNSVKGAAVVAKFANPIADAAAKTGETAVVGSAVAGNIVDAAEKTTSVPLTAGEISAVGANSTAIQVSGIPAKELHADIKAITDNQNQLNQLQMRQTNPLRDTQTADADDQEIQKRIADKYTLQADLLEKAMKSLAASGKKGSSAYKALQSELSTVQEHGTVADAWALLKHESNLERTSLKAGLTSGKMPEEIVKGRQKALQILNGVGAKLSLSPENLALMRKLETEAGLVGPSAQEVDELFTALYQKKLAEKLEQVIVTDDGHVSPAQEVAEADQSVNQEMKETVGTVEKVCPITPKRGVAGE